MAGRRRTPRAGTTDRRHPLRNIARLRASETVPASDPPAAVKERLTVKIRRELIEQLRNAVYYTPGLTITSFIEACISENLAKMEKRRGSAFPERTEALRAGRPRSKNRVE